MWQSFTNWPFQIIQRRMLINHLDTTSSRFGLFYFQLFSLNVWKIDKTSWCARQRNEKHCLRCIGQNGAVGKKCYLNKSMFDLIYAFRCVVRASCKRKINMLVLVWCLLVSKQACHCKGGDLFSLPIVVDIVSYVRCIVYISDLKRERDMRKIIFNIYNIEWCKTTNL